MFAYIFVEGGGRGGFRVYYEFRDGKWSYFSQMVEMTEKEQQPTADSDINISVYAGLGGGGGGGGRWLRVAQLIHLEKAVKNVAAAFTVDSHAAAVKGRLPGSFPSASQFLFEPGFFGGASRPGRRRFCTKNIIWLLNNERSSLRNFLWKLLRP